MAIPKQWLYIRCDLTGTLVEDATLTGKTCRLRICATESADPSAIGSCTASATASGGTFTLTIARATLVSDLAAYIGKWVWAHFDDGAAWHYTIKCKVTNTAPGLLTAVPT